MIEFKSIKYVNFQSVGNAGIKIELNRSQTTLLGGDNGSGKSTVLESMSYCLFGKPLKKVKLSGLINTLNKKNMVTECVFTKHGDEYKVIRGEKPKKFEIHKNGEMLDQNAASKDYQYTLERILGMDHKLFTQVVLLNRERYIPFMDMGAADRRKVVEDILDINIFGYMNDIVKKNISTLKTELSDKEYERGLLVTKREGVTKLIEQAQSNIEDHKKELQDKIQWNVTLINKIQDDIAGYEEQKSDLQGYVERHEKLTKEKSKLSEFSSKFSEKLKKISDEQGFYQKNTTCPTCTQEIAATFKDSILDSLESKKDEIKTSSEKLYDRAQEVVNEIKKTTVKLEQINNIQLSINMLQNEWDYTKRENGNLNRQIKELSEKQVDDDLVDQATELDKKIETLNDELNSMMNECEEYETMKGMLKDDGIKATIVDDYVGFINKRMNEYLNSMGFFINITLDGNFNETVNSINKQGFTYDNLSTGQKTRVNLAILMVLLEVSALKNSAVCNLIFIDELLENLDQDGVSLFMNLIKEEFRHKNIFVVTQRYDEFKDYFRSELYFEQGEDQFTMIKN